MISANFAARSPKMIQERVGCEIAVALAPLADLGCPFDCFSDGVSPRLGARGPVVPATAGGDSSVPPEGDPWVLDAPRPGQGALTTASMTFQLMVDLVRITLGTLALYPATPSAARCWIGFLPE